MLQMTQWCTLSDCQNRIKHAAVFRERSDQVLIDYIDFYTSQPRLLTISKQCSTVRTQACTVDCTSVVLKSKELFLSYIINQLLLECSTIMISSQYYNQVLLE